MNKIKNKGLKNFLILIFITIILAIIMYFIFYVGPWYKYEKKRTNLIKNSNVLTDEIGEIESIENKFFELGERTESGRYIYYDIETKSGKTYKVKVITHRAYNGIYAYEVNGKTIYEEGITPIEE